MTWLKFSGERIQCPITQEVEDALKRESAKGYKLKVCIGTDSMVRNGTMHFATVIVIVREHHGGFMYIKRSQKRGRVTIKERMLMEVSKSIEIAYEICDIMDEYGVDLEVHADINTNPNFKSNKALSDAMGYILSMGFIFKAKPEAFASTSCANRKV